jgi:chemotaxis protein methyltransferase CheR
LNTQHYQNFCQYLESQCGIVLGDNKQYLVKSRLTPLAREFGIDDVDQVIDRVIKGTDRRLSSAVVDAMTTNETQWFRDKYPFEILGNKLIPEILANQSTVKIWSAACSSGQEPYSIAMVATDLKRQQPGFRGNVQITATDISPSMLDHCREARYDRLSIARGLSEHYRNSYFDDCDDGAMVIKREVKQLVQFKPLNLLESYGSMGRFDIIFCRNVLIYFSADVKAKILQQFAACLNKGGYLFLGASESISGLSNDFDMVRCNPGIIYQRK